MHFSIDRTVHTTAFDKPVVDHWLERKIAQTAAGSTDKDRSDDRPLQRRARYLVLMKDILNLTLILHLILILTTTNSQNVFNICKRIITIISIIRMIIM